MTSQTEAFIDFLDAHWCETVTAEVGQAPTFETIAKLQELRLDYLRQLYTMTPEELHAATIDVLLEQDRSRPFSQFGTEADFEHFGRCAFLSPHEAVALSFGKDPRVVTWEMVSPYLGASAFAYQFASRLDLVDRAIAWKELPPRFTPLQFLTWAHTFQIPVPEAFINCTFARGEPIHYWHDQCATLTAKLQETEAALEATRVELATSQSESQQLLQRTFEEWLTEQQQVERRHADSETKIAELQRALVQADVECQSLREQAIASATDPVESDHLSTTERKSLLTLVIAAATDVYGFNPADSRSPVPAQFASAAQLVGLTMTDDTARKFIKQAMKLKGFVAPEGSRKKPNSVKRKPKSA